MENDLTSIIMTCYLQEPFQAHMTMAALANIARYTDPDTYELILMSDSEKFPVRDDYKVLKIDRYERTKGFSYTQAMNAGAKLARGNYLCFIQNDVFVWNEWLGDLKEYILRNMTDCVYPEQTPCSYEYFQSTTYKDYDETFNNTAQDEGLFLITREAFRATRGFNEQPPQVKDFQQRMDQNNIRYITTSKVFITHIKSATKLSLLHRNPLEYDQMMKKNMEVLV